MEELHILFVKYFLSSVGLLLWGMQLQAQIFVTPSGDDLNSGTLEQPFATITKAHSVAQAGDTIFVRGGVYPLLTTVNLSKYGTATQRIHLFAYPGERPILDFSGMALSGSNRGIRFQGWYWHIKGLDIKGAGDNGILVDNGSYNIIEFCSLYENRDTGLQLANGAAHNRIINCDSYSNADPSHGNADGFAPKLTVGTGNSFYGCRAWQNSDDGFDGYLRGADDVTTVLEHCWIFKNGYLSSGVASNGNGNGFKLGGGDNGNSDSLKHNVILKSCIAFDNRVKGFDQNNNRGSMTIHNGSAYRNGTNYSLSQTLVSGKILTVINSLAVGPFGSIGSFAVQQTNSWMLPFTVTSADFASLDTTGMRGPRKPDGSLPDVPFLRLAGGSGLIDAGTNVEIPYHGAAPDIGAFESGGPITSMGPDNLLPGSFSVFQNYPNPFNPETMIEFELPLQGEVGIQVFDIAGRLVKDILRGELGAGRYRMRWDGTDALARLAASGVYLAVVQYGGQKKTLKLQLLK